jgi:predicted GNAT superfamily acetyltransferase
LLSLSRADQPIWGGGPADEIPIHILVTIGKNGGGVLAAYAEDGPADLDGMVGMALWWLGVDNHKRFKICSHMAGVLPDWQGRGVGALLKFKQREIVLEQGITDWITWTYDPLYRTNGVFNIHRLGATCNTYYRNVYGELNDDLNRGAPSDRCQVDWWLRSERVENAVKRQGQRGVPKANYTGLQVLPSTLNREGFRQPQETSVPVAGAPLALPIPDDIGAIRRTDPELGKVWRLYVREVLEAAFAAGYVMVDCINLPEQGWHYILIQTQESSATTN